MLDIWTGNRTETVIKHVFFLSCVNVSLIDSLTDYASVYTAVYL